jgi:hypothetical protein
LSKGFGLTVIIELQGHAIKNKDLLAASGAITLRGPESFDELQEDEQAVSTLHNLTPHLSMPASRASISP